MMLDSSFRLKLLSVLMIAVFGCSDCVQSFFVHVPGGKSGREVEVKSVT